MPDPSHICNPHHSSWQCCILNPQNEPTSSWILVRFISVEPQWELQLSYDLIQFNYPELAQTPQAKGLVPQNASTSDSTHKFRQPVLLTNWWSSCGGRVPINPSSGLIICWKASRTQGNTIYAYWFIIKDIKVIKRKSQKKRNIGRTSEKPWTQ